MNKQVQVSPEAEARISTVMDHYKSARSQAARDPHAVMLHARIVAETVCHHVFADKGSPNTKSAQLDQLLSQLKNEDMPSSVRNHMRTIQRYANPACHHQPTEPGVLSPGDVSICLIALDAVVNWYFFRYLKWPESKTDVSPEQASGAGRLPDELRKHSAPCKGAGGKPSPDAENDATTALLLGAVGGAAAAILGATLVGKVKKKKQADSLKEILDKMRTTGQTRRK